MEKAKQNWFKRHKKLTIMGGIILLFIIIGAVSGGGKPQGTTPAASQSPAQQKDTSQNQDASKNGSTQKISLGEFYDQVQNDMTKEQVTKLAQRDGQNCTEVQDQYLGKIESCNYGGFSDGGIVSVTFTNGKVSTKTKTDL
jgi:hypothetical protein